MSRVSGLHESIPNSFLLLFLILSPIDSGMCGHAHKNPCDKCRKDSISHSERYSECENKGRYYYHDKNTAAPLPT